MHNSPHPGQILLDILQQNRISISDLARRIKVNRPYLSKIIHAKAAISVPMAYRLEKLFSISVDTWLNLQRSYDKANIRVDTSFIVPIDTRKNKREELSTA